MTPEEKKERDRLYYLKNKEKLKLRQKKYYHDNKEKISENRKVENLNDEQIEKKREKGKSRYRVNKEKVLKYHREYYQINKDRIKEKVKQYNEENREKTNLRTRNKKKTNVLYKLMCGYRTSINGLLKNRGFRKKSKTVDILGCSVEEFKQHLENQFESWMNWDNYGKYNGELNYGWDIDHIIPQSAAKTEEELLSLNHYTNLKPLCSKINRYIKKITPNFHRGLLNGLC
jgi:hypothetical protein